MADTNPLSSPKEVVLAFAAAYTAWEQDMLAAADGFSDAKLQSRHTEILLNYCTHKKRAYVDGIASVANPPTYYKVVPETIASVAQVTDSRTYVDTSHLGTYAYRFVVLKKQDGWRIDSIKRRFSPTGDWKNTLIGS